MDVFGVIYKITNIRNNKVYIGQTIQKLDDRINRHFRDARNGRDTIFCRAIRRYGEESFVWEVIDVAYSEQELDEKEIYWIKHYNAYVNWENSNGYNMRVGGEGLRGEDNPNCKLSRESIEEIIDLAKTGKYTIPMIAKEFGVAKNTIYNIFNLSSCWNSVVKELVTEEELNTIKAKIKEFTKKWRSKRLSELKSKENHHMWGKRGANNPFSKPVLQIDLNTGEVLREFPSATEASKYVNAPDCSKIARVCRGERKSAYGYKWVYKENYNNGLKAKNNDLILLGESLA